MEAEIQSWLGIIFQGVIAAGVGYGIFQRFIEAQLASTRAATVQAGTLRAEEAARLAASKAAEAAAGMIGVAANVEKIELATNSMKDALVASTAKASHLEGRAEAASEAAAAAEKKK